MAGERGGRRYQLAVCRGPFSRFLGQGQYISNARKEGGKEGLRGQMRNHRDIILSASTLLCSLFPNGFVCCLCLAFALF